MNRTVVVTFLAILSLSTGCGGTGEETCDGADPRALEEWSKHRAFLDDRGIGETERDTESWVFFSELVGVDIRYNWGYVGGAPTGETLQDFEFIDKWFEENCRRLRWDEIEETVFLE